jgi:hypothetical protein
MPLFVGRRYPVIEIELVPSDPGVYDLGQAISESQNSGILIAVYGLGESISDTDGSIVSNYLIDAETISESDNIGDLLKTLEPGECVSEIILDGNTFIYLSKNTYSDGVNTFTYAQWLEAQAVSETDTLGDLLRTYGLGESQSDGDSEYTTWFTTRYLDDAVSDTDGLHSWTYLLCGSAESILDVDGEKITTHQPGQTISDTEATFPNWLYTFILGEGISESRSEFAYTFQYAGEAVSETYGSWILSIHMGEAVSDTDGEYEFAGKALHDLIELDDTINRAIVVTTGVARVVNLEAYLIRK